MLTKTEKLTYEAWLQLPEIKQRYEVIDGELRFMSPAPTPRHQLLSRNLFRLIDRFVVEYALGEVLYAPIDVMVQQVPLRTRQPDLLFVSEQRRGIIGAQYIAAGPELVVEILSPSNTRADMEEKLADYWSIQVQECWLVSPEARTVEVLHHTAHGFERTGLYGIGDVIVSQILPELRLRVESLW